MEITQIKDGYLFHPKEWTVIKNRCPQDSHYVGVVEIRNGEAYNAPHFIFFSEKPIIELSAKEEQIIIGYCIESHPELGAILEQHIPLQFDTRGKIINGLAWQSSPLAGCFVVAELGSREAYPYGAMIIRTQHRGKQ